MTLTKISFKFYFAHVTDLSTSNSSNSGLEKLILDTKPTNKIRLGDKLCYLQPQTA